MLMFMIVIVIVIALISNPIHDRSCVAPSGLEKENGRNPGRRSSTFAEAKADSLGLGYEITAFQA
jgi:hypothetical protein